MALRSGGNIRTKDEEKYIVATEQRSDPNNGWLRSRSGLIGVGFIAIAAFFLWTEHRAHLLGVLPYVLLLLCPILHYLMHGRHGGHDGSHDAKPGGAGK